MGAGRYLYRGRGRGKIPLRLRHLPPQGGEDAPRGLAEKVGERLGGQVPQMQGGAEDHRERISRCVTEDRRSRRGRWGAWAPKIRLPFRPDP